MAESSKETRAKRTLKAHRVSDQNTHKTYEQLATNANPQLKDAINQVLSKSAKNINKAKKRERRAEMIPGYAQAKVRKMRAKK